MVMSRTLARDIDRYIGFRIRQRRTMLGLTRQHMAEQIGVTYQQAHKYENGTNRITAGRLYRIAEALEVEVSYFFQGMDDEESFRPSSRQRMVLDLARNVISMPRRDHQEAICMVARAMVDPEPAEQQE